MLGDKNDRKDSIYSFFIFMHKRIYALCVLVCECENTYVCKISWTPQPQYAYMFILEDNLRSTYSRGVHLNYNYHFFYQDRVFFPTFLEMAGTLTWQASELEISVSVPVLGWQLHEFCWTLLNVFWAPIQTSLLLQKALYMLALSLS